MSQLHFYQVVSGHPSNEKDADGTGTLQNSGEFEVTITWGSVKKGYVYEIRQGIDTTGDKYNCKRGGTTERGGNKTAKFEKVKSSALDLEAANQEQFSEALTAGDGSSYGVTITMSQDTVTALTGGGYQLYGFKAVQTTQKGGAPLVWFASTTFALQTVISWQEQYAAYTSLNQIIPKGTIVASSSYPISLGQSLNVTGQTGTGNVTTNGTQGAISVLNATTNPFTCGISQSNPDGSTSPMCAFPLYGNGLDVFAPIEQVLLMFSTLPINTGTVIYQAYSQGLFIDLTAENTRASSFDINKGWSWDGGPWAKTVQANDNLVPFLIQSSPSLAKRQLAAI